jgi:ribosomal protein L7/L12
MTKRTRVRAQKSPVKALAEVHRLAKANQTIAAIKLYQQETGVGLRQAIDAVNALRADRGDDDT